MPDPGPLLRAALCLLGAVLLLPRRPDRRLLVGFALLTLSLILAPPLWRLVRGEGLRDYTFAHYRLGAKYSAELGYDGLYAAMLAEDPGGDWQKGGPAVVDELRDLRTHELVPRPERSRHVAPDPSLGSAVPPFSPVRAASFAADLAFFQPRLSAADWRSFFRDKGFNASPAWTATFGRLLTAVPASVPAFTALALLDLALLAVAFFALGLAWGPVPALLTAAVLALLPGAEGNLLGGPLQLDWIAASLASFAAALRGRPLLAGAFFGWAIASRLFPAFLLAGPLLALLLGVVPARRAFLRSAGRGLLLSLGFALVLGATTPRGPAAWSEFATKITMHAAHQHEGDRRVGLDPLLSWAPVGERSPVAARQDRAERWHDRAPWVNAARGLLLVLWTLAVARGLLRGRLEAEPDGRAIVGLLLLALPVPFLLVAQSRYYALLPAALLLLHPQAARPLGIALFVTSAATLLVSLLPAADVTWYAVWNLGLLTLAAVALARFAARRPGA